MKTKYILILLLSISLFACGDSSDAKRRTMIVASAVGDCTKPNGEPLKCLYVKLDGGQNWETFGWNIEGFRYVSGYEYEIVVDQVKLDNAVPGGPQYRWILKDEISKEQKHSEGLPA